MMMQVAASSARRNFKEDWLVVTGMVLLLVRC
jgi:hypothetical protein